MFYDAKRIPTATRALGDAILEDYGYRERDLIELNFKEIKEYIKARATCKMMQDT